MLFRSQTVQARFNSTTDVLNVPFNPTPSQLETIKTLPGDLQKQMDRLQKLVKERIPALQKSLEAAGVQAPKGHH